MSKPITPEDALAAVGESLASAARTMAFHVRDWGAERRDAWLWGILCGWDGDDGDSMSECVTAFGWSPSEVMRLRRLHAVVARAVEIYEIREATKAGGRP